MKIVDAERKILEAGWRLLKVDVLEFTGFQIGEEIAMHDGKRIAMGYGTLYLALERLEKAGSLSSRWEEYPPDNRPRRRFYRLTEVKR